MKNKDQILLENAYLKVVEAYSDSEFEDDLNVGSTNMPHGMGYPNKRKEDSDWDKIVKIDSYADDWDGNKEIKYPSFVTAYDVTRNYGGPEEGGWWYTAQTMIDSIEVNSPEETQQAARKLYDEIKGTTDGKLSIELESEKGSLEMNVNGQPRYE